MQARWVLEALEVIVSLTGTSMKWKPKKSIFFVLRKDQVNRLGKIQIQGEQIPSIVGNLIKCLGKWFNESLTDKDSIEDTKKRFYLNRTEGS